MPDTKKKRKPLLIDLPPEEAYTDFGGETGISGIEGLPEDLKPEYFYKVMREDFPDEIYIAQLMDYYMENKVNPTERGFQGELRKLKPTMTFEQANEQVKLARLLLSWGRTPEDLHLYDKNLPLYSELTRMAGPAVRKIYEAYANDFVEEEKIKKAQESVQRAGMVEATRKMYGEDAALALERQILTPEEMAMRQTQRDKEGWQRQGEVIQDQYSRYGKDLAEAIRKGDISPEQALAEARRKLPIGNSMMGDITARQQVQLPENRQRLQDAVAKGLITGEEAFGYGTPWNEWQNKMATEENRARGAVPGGGQVDQTLINLIQQAKAMGFDTSQAEMAAQPGQSREVQAMYATGLNDQIKAAREQQKSEYANWLTQDYADVYKTWQEKMAPLGTKGVGITPTDFLSWIGENEEGVPNAEWQKAYTAKEAKRWGDYGDIYGTYRSRLGAQVKTGGYKKAKPFETWLTEDPWAVTEMQKKSRADLEEEQRRKRQLVGVGGGFR